MNIQIAMIMIMMCGMIVRVRRVGVRMGSVNVIWSG